MRLRASFTALVALLALAGCQEEPAPPEAPRPVVSEVVSPRQGARQVFVGTVVADVETDLGFPLIGTIAELPLEAGDVVAPGATLAELDPEELDADLRAADAGVSVAQAQLNSARDAAERARALAARGVDSTARVEDAEQALASAEAQLEQALASRARAADLRSFAVLHAPQAGVITEVYVETGATVAAGESVLTLASTENREVLIDLTEQDAAAFSPGITFNVALEAADDITAQAVLTSIDPVAESATRTRRAHLSLQNPAPAFRLGALARVAPATDAGTRLTLPASSIIDRDGAAATIWVIDRSKDAVERRNVHLGAAFGGRVEVTEGLLRGEEVLIRGIHSIEDGQSVGPQVSR